MYGERKILMEILKKYSRENNTDKTAFSSAFIELDYGNER